MHSPVLLNNGNGFDWSFVTLEHQGGDTNASAHFVLVVDTVKKFIIARLVYQVDFTTVAQRGYLATINICHFNT